MMRWALIIYPLTLCTGTQPHSVQQRRKYDSWNDNNLVPFGVGGFGYMSQCQFYNEADLDRYLSRVEAEEKPVWRGSALSKGDLMRRTVMFALRSSGVLLSRFEQEFGMSMEHTLVVNLKP